MTVQPFRIEVHEAVLADLRERLARTRWLDGHGAASWESGTNAHYLEELCAYWRRDFDWRKQERNLNAFRHFRAEIDGLRIHFIHEKAKGEGAIPLLLLHGWPDSFARFLKVIPILTQGASGGARGTGPVFDVIVPSLPGYGFSEKPNKAGMTFKFGDLLHKLMTEELGYEMYAVQGGDWGAMVAEQMARSHSGSLIGIHLTDVPFYHMFNRPKTLSSAEEKYLKKMEEFQQKEGAYAMVQSTRPATLAMGLNDSPAGLASWMVDKFRAWSDCDGDVENRFSRDELLTHIMIYWVTQTIESSFGPYFDLAHAGAMRWTAEGIKSMLGSKKVPAGFSLFPKDLVTPPREWAERFFKVERWTEMGRGGHFAAMEEPEMFARELRGLFGVLWAEAAVK